MRPRTKFGVLIVAAILIVAAAMWFAPAGPRPAPDLKLSIIDGSTLRLAELRGRPLIVTFWATTCPGCIREIPHFIDLYAALAPKGLEIVAIAMYYDPPNRVIEMSRRLDIPYKIALDINADAARAFGNVRITPTNFLIAPNGDIVRHKIGEFTDEELASLRRQIEQMILTASHRNA